MNAPPLTLPSGLVLQVGHTAELDADVLRIARALLDRVFGDDMRDEDWDHALGGVHALVWADTALVGHGSVIQRRLLHGGRALRTGYVEGVAVHPEWRRRGIGGAVMASLERVVDGAYEIGALGASDDGALFYAARTPDEDDGIFVRPVGAPLDPTAALTCDWRDGDAR